MSGTAATNGAASPGATTSPTRRHQIKRSLSEFASPGKSGRSARRERPAAAAGSSYYYPDDGGVGRTGNGPQHLRYPSVAADSRMSLDIPRSNGFSPAMSPDQSRRGSLLLPPALPLPPAARDGKEDGQRASSTESSDVRLRQNQARIAGNTETLTQSLAELNDFSANASRQLDDAYYAVLEKMSLLHATVASLRGLAETSHGIYDTFEKDSRSLENQIATQLGAMGHFQGHQTKVSSLQRRIDKGRGQMQALSDRLDAVRSRVERWERADRQWQERTRKRLKIIWSVMSVAVLVLVVLLWTVSSSSGSEGRERDVPADELGRKISILEPLNASDSLQPPGQDRAEGQARILWKTPVGGTDRLRVFDEL